MARVHLGVRGLTLLALLAASPISAQSLEVAQWQEDIDVLVKTLRAHHPMPFARVEESAFLDEVKALRGKVGQMSDVQVAVALMRLVSSLADGHTVVLPGEMNAVRSTWYPIRLYRFPTGVYVTSVHRKHAKLVGSKVLTIGGRPAEEVVDLAAEYYSPENASGRRERIYLTSNASIMTSLGVGGPALNLSVKLANGESATASIKSINRAYHMDWAGWGETAAPFGVEGAPVVSWNGVKTSDFYRRSDPKRPLHLRRRSGFNWAHVPESQVVYFQMNFTTRKSRGEELEGILDRLFKLLDEDEKNRFVLDLRYNFGGDGSIAPSILHRILARPQLNTSGRLYVITGRQTFSAALILVGHLARHTKAIFVGEPPSAGIDHFGNPQSIRLPNSKLLFNYSTVYHQYSEFSSAPGRAHRVFAPDIPGVMTAKDYFAGKDPVLAPILTGQDLRPIDVIVEQDGAEIARKILASRLEQFGGFTWWTAIDERRMNAAGYRVLRSGRTKEAIAIFEMNSQGNPNSANVWDSLGEAYLAGDRQKDAVSAYQRSLSLDPGNATARRVIKKHGGQ